MAKSARRIARHGFDTTTVRQIAEDANMMSGSLYHHFATKDDILREIVWRPICELRGAIVRIGAEVADAETKLVAMVRVTLRKFVVDYFPHAILYNERRLFRQATKFAEILAIKKNIYDVWMKIIDDGIAETRFNPAIDSYQAIRMTLRMLNSTADWYARDDDSIQLIRANYSLEQLEDQQLIFILGAVRDARWASAAVPKAVAARIADID